MAHLQFATSRYGKFIARRLVGFLDKAVQHHNVVGNRLFYEQLKRDQEQARGKYGKSKGKATRGLVTGSLFPQVEQRPMSVYDQFSQGGVSWNN